MSDEQYSTTELDTLLAGALDLRLDDAQMTRFEQLLSESQAIDHYVDHAILHAMLRWEHTRPLDGVTDDPWLQPLPVITSQQPAEGNIAPGIGFLSPSLFGTSGYFSEGLPLAYLVATVVMALGYFDRLARLYVLSRAGCSTIDPSPLSPLPTPLRRRPNHRHG